MFEAVHAARPARAAEIGLFGHAHIDRDDLAAQQPVMPVQLGEGDERWIVEEKGRDGVNVNGWHWQELDCLSWAKVCLYERQLRGVCTCLLV